MVSKADAPMGSRSMGGRPRDVRGWVGFPDECKMDGQSGERERERAGFLSGIFDGEKEGTVSSVASGMGWETGVVLGRRRSRRIFVLLFSSPKMTPA